MLTVVVQFEQYECQKVTKVGELEDLVSSFLLVLSLISLRCLAWLHGESWHLEHWHSCHWWHLSHLWCSLSVGLSTSWHLASHVLLQQSCVLHLLMIHVNVLLLHEHHLLLHKLLLLRSHVLSRLDWWCHHHVRILSLRELHSKHLRIHHLRLGALCLSFLSWLSLLRLILLIFLISNLLFLF